MTTQYLLPCSCGAKLTVQRSQAGENVTCGCGATVEVPTMRGLRQFEQVEIADAKAGWTRMQGALYVLGIFCLMVGTALIIWQLRRPAGPPLVSTDEVIMPLDENQAVHWLLISARQPAAVLQLVDDLDGRQSRLAAGESLRYWSLCRDLPHLMLNVSQHRSELAAQRSRQFWIVGTAASVSGILGLAFILAAWAAGRK